MKKSLCFIFLLILFFSCAPVNEYKKAPLSLKQKDIPVPMEMKMLTNESVLVKILSSEAKYLVFRGQVSPDSLFDYYMIAMRKNNWQIKSYFKNKIYLMLFEKNRKICVINIVESPIFTYLYIWVLPDINFLSQIPIKEENILK